MTRSSLTVQSRCALFTLKRFFQKLKALGIYDSSLIVLHGDHGGWVGNYRNNAQVKVDEKSPALPDWIESLASPLLMVKAPNQKGQVRSDSSLVSILQIPNTISDVFEFADQYRYPSLLDNENNQLSTRPFFYYDFGSRKLDQTEFSPYIIEFAIEGSHYETDWQFKRAHVPPELK